MFVGNGDNIMGMLMNSPGTCPKCGKGLTFNDAAQLAKSNGIQDNVVMCKGCNHVFEVNLVPGCMTLTQDVTEKYPQIKPKKSGGFFGKLFGGRES